MAKRLTDKHPTSKGIDKVFALMDKLGLRLEMHDYGVVRIVDKKHGSFLMCDAELGGVHEFPPVFEYKILLEE